ncbi:hypothetical protein AUK40_00980 [Candidatus Wirthbacteria bacterium CG2_30_54_11]|uniref:Hydrogenase maturation factor HypA n=1 Tax=Candidatus Wirthbacteria bacterium CG2_30_54_11 TaxID=1817892 RepID=A0A1J5IPH2_9BACT|nr:MAG: hypothetical protein AUK40_00980 [Candidatus Wirthbacteria bacterium CG2_30_54_11]
MHELGIASEIVSVVTDALNNQSIGRPVKKIRLTIGEMRQIVPDSLQFCFDSLTRDTLLENARLEIRHIPLSGTCSSCGREIEFTEPPFRCPDCSGTEMQMQHGFELDVTSFEVED